MKRLSAALIILSLSASAEAADKSAASSDIREELLAILPGEFDSQGQLAVEQAVNTPEDLQHGHVYRSYVVVDAPALGEKVLVGTVRYGGRDGFFDKSEFQVWTMRLADNEGQVTMKPRRFKDPDAYAELGRDVAALSALTPEDLLPPTGAAGCDILWRKHERRLIGATDGDACVNMSSTLKKELSWEWTYVLGRNGIWLSYAGRDETGDIVNGRVDQLPWYLERIR